MEFMLQNHVFPLFRNELGYMRARVSDSKVLMLLHNKNLNNHCTYTNNNNFPIHRPAGCCITSVR